MERNDRQIFLRQVQAMPEGRFTRRIDDLVSGKIQTELEFEDYVKDWIEGEIGTNAYKAQIKYLRKTSTPSNIDVKKWIKKVRNINAILPLMSSKATKMTDTDLLRAWDPRKYP